MPAIVADIVAAFERPRRGTPAWLDAARERLFDRMAEPPSLVDLAERVGVHAVHLAQAFRRHFGITPMGFVRGHRVFRAVELIAAGMPLARAAAEVGFADQSHMTRAIAEARRAPPATLRQLMRPNLVQDRRNWPRYASGMRFVACCVVVACSQPVVTPPPAPTTGSDLAFEIGAIDPKADPCTDFYAYACGGWRSTHPIPPDRTRWSRYAELEELDLAHERSLVEAAATGTRIGDYYAACLDVAAIDTRGLEPIRDMLHVIDTIAKPADVTDAIATLHRGVGSMLFSATADSDPRDARTTMLGIDLGELGLDEPDDYARADADSAAMRTSYAKHVERLLALAGDRDAAADAGRVMSVETTLAGALPRADQRRERAAQVHVMSLAELAQHAPAIDWPRYLKALGAPSVERANVDVRGVSRSRERGCLGPRRGACLSALSRRSRSRSTPASRDRRRGVRAREDAARSA